MRSIPPWSTVLASVTLTLIFAAIASGLAESQAVADDPQPLPAATDQDSNTPPPPPAVMAQDSVAGAAPAHPDSAVLAADAPVAMMPGLADTVWVLRLGGRIADLDSALTWCGRLQREGLPSFARVRAVSTAYWYELFAGPTATQSEIDSVREVISMRGWFREMMPRRVSLDEARLGEVGRQTGRSSPPGRDSSDRLDDRN